MTTKAAKDFKDWALKSGFPFENTVQQVIQKVLGSESFLARNCNFVIKNHEDKDAIRSLDFVCKIKKQSQNFPNIRTQSSTEVSFLVECKYTSEEYFMFLPSTRVLDENVFWPSLIPGHRPDALEDEEAYIFEQPSIKNLAKPSNDTKIAFNGRKVAELSGDRNSVTPMLLQVLQCTLDTIDNRLQELSYTTSMEKKREAQIYIPIVVTSAPLLVLKPDVDVEKVSSSSQKDEIFTQEDSVYVEMPDLWDLQMDWIKIQSKIYDYNTYGKYTGGNIKAPIKFPIIRGTLHRNYVLFCNLKGLEKHLLFIKDNFEKVPAR